MNLPDVRAGMAILADHIQRLNAAIRQVQVRPGIGYRVQQSGGGTTLVINRSTVGGGGGGTVQLPCPFECTDASDEEALKVQVKWGLIWQMLPTGMQPDNDPPLKLTVEQTCYIYSRIIFDTNTLMPTDISFQVETEIKTNTSSTQYNLVAIVTVDTTQDPAVITGIENICQQPFPSPCALT